MIEAVKVALDPTPRQIRQLRSHCGGSRFAYNVMLNDVKEEIDKSNPPQWSYFDLINKWNQIKHDVAIDDNGHPWWKENSSECYEHGLQSLANGLKNWHKSKKKKSQRKVHFPKPKKRNNNYMSFSYRSGVFGPIKNDPYGIKCPRIGRIHCMENVLRRTKNDHVKNMTISCKAGKWFASIAVEREDNEILSNNDRPQVGIDLGVSRVATLSDGKVIENPRIGKKHERKIKKAHKDLSRKEKGSKNREKARERLAKLCVQAVNERQDFIHKMTSMLVNNYSEIKIEDLNVSGMVKNHHLASAISDVSFYEIRRQLEYKCKKKGVKLEAIDRFYPSSKMCSECGNVKNKLSLSERTYICENCGLEIDRDLNAAINIKNHVAESASET